MQHDYRACGQFVEAGQHIVETQTMRSGIVVRIGVHFEAGEFQQCAMIFPAGIADPRFGAGIQAPQIIRADFESAGAAECLHGHYASAFHGFAVRAENHLLYGFVVDLQAVDRQIVARHRGCGELLLGAAHGLQHRYLAVVVGVHAHPEIHLFRIGISDIDFGDTQNRVFGRHFDVSKQ